MKAQLCPVCLGTGKIFERNYLTTSTGEQKTCHGCGGRGWVEVTETEYRITGVLTSDEHPNNL